LTEIIGVRSSLVRGFENLVVNFKFLAVVFLFNDDTELPELESSIVPATSA
jgi:hypothetical protein